MYSACPKCQRSPSTTSAASVSQPISDRGSRSNGLARNLLHPSAAAAHATSLGRAVRTDRWWEGPVRCVAPLVSF